MNENEDKKAVKSTSGDAEIRRTVRYDSGDIDDMIFEGNSSLIVSEK